MKLRRTACALALPAFPLALLASALVTPTDSTENDVQLVAAAAHGPTWVAATLFELLAAALLPFAVFGVVTAIRERGAGLANAGGVLGVLGTLGMASIAFRHVFIYGLAGMDSTQALHALDRIDHTFGPLVLPMMFCAPIALVVLAGAAARARIVPLWLPVGCVVFFVVDMLPIPGAEIAQGLLGIAVLGLLARAILSGPRSPDRSPRFEAALEA